MGWDYCCCAIPVLNVGAYFTLTEQFILGILVGTLAYSTPALVGASVPSWSYLVLVGLGYGFAVLQLIGFFGIFKEKAGLFKTYVTFNYLVLYAGLAASATFIAISGTRHSAAVDSCVDAFYNSNDDGAGHVGAGGEGKQICEVFTWVSVGIMGALWVVMCIIQSYLVLVLRNYSSTQRADHSKYRSIYSQAEDLPLNARNAGGSRARDEWDARPSTDSWHPNASSAGRPEFKEDAGDDDNDIYEKKYGYGNGGVGSSGAKADVQSVGGNGKNEYDAGYTPSRKDSEFTVYSPGKTSYNPPPIPPPSAGGYAPSVAAPSYHTMSPGQQTQFHQARG